MITKTQMEERAERLNKILEGRNAGFRVTYHEIWKNGGIRTAYILEGDGYNCAPVIYTDDWYNLPDEQVITYLLHMSERHTHSLDVKAITSRDYIESHIMPRIVNSSNIPDLQHADIAYRPYLDLAVVYYMPIQDIAPLGSDGETPNVQITNRYLHIAGIDENTAYEYSMNNFAEQVDAMPMMDILTNVLGADELPSIPVADAPPLWVITNRSKIYGASALLFDDAVFDLMEAKFGSDSHAAILPSSQHELIVTEYTDDESLYKLLEMVKEVNATQVSAEEFLSDNVYYRKNGHVCALV